MVRIMVKLTNVFLIKESIERDNIKHIGQLGLVLSDKLEDVGWSVS